MMKSEFWDWVCTPTPIRNPWSLKTDLSGDPFERYQWACAFQNLEILTLGRWKTEMRNGEYVMNILSFSILCKVMTPSLKVFDITYVLMTAKFVLLLWTCLPNLRHINLVFYFIFLPVYLFIDKNTYINLKVQNSVSGLPSSLSV